MQDFPIGRRVNHIRVYRGDSLRKFAELAGVNFNTLKRLEDGRAINSQAFLAILSEAGIVLSQCNHEWETRCVRCGSKRRGRE